MSILLLIFGLLMFVGLVVIHEYGHYLAARKSGVVVEEFGIGFPPRAWARKLKSGMLFTLNWLPLGGFVKLKGENDSATEKGSYGSVPLKNKVLIMTAGVVMNLLTAFVLFTFLALVGMPKLIENQFTIPSDTKVVRNQVLVGYVSEGSPAEKSGLLQRDQIISVTSGDKSYQLTSADQLPGITKELAGEEISVTVVRDGQTQVIETQLRGEQEVKESLVTNEPKGYLGVSPSEYTIQRSTWSAPIVAAGVIKQFTTETLKGLGSAIGNLIKGNGGAASSQVSGPVGIFVILKDGSLLGYQFILMIIAIISLTLAIMNILPIPALDGGRLFVTLIYHKILRRPLSKETEERIHGTGFAVLMLLFILITFVDVRRFF
ncbi:site-2 protease family protein [Candidatus Saccharibacteria bacterium]|nr:site-2 protease family protein [Candidatus Saccharibacteria bacterium]